MNRPHLRRGHTYRIYDWGRWSLILDPESRGGGYSPMVGLVYRQPKPEPGRPKVVRIRRWEWRLPLLGWPHAYAWRRFGSLRLYQWQSRLAYRLMALRITREEQGNHDQEGSQADHAVHG